MSIIEEAKSFIGASLEDVPDSELREACEVGDEIIKDLIKALEQSEAVTEAAKFLVKVKNNKDTNGKGAWYQASWPIALRKIEEALAQLPEEG